MIRLGVDAWNLPGDHRGIGRYVRALLRHWSADFSGRIAPVLIVPEWHTWTVASKYRAEAGAAYPVRSRKYHARAGLDLLWFPFNGPSWDEFSLPSVATLHDASTFVLPGFDDAARATFRRAAARCDRILTDSEFSRKELLRELEIAGSRITAIPLGAGEPLPPSGERPRVRFERYALFVGETEARKGYDTLMAALEELRASGLTIPLVVAGKVVGELQGDHGALLVLGHVSDTELAALYRNCAVFVYPSRYEGFGLPVLEAMSYGAPVIASSAGSILEAGGDAPIYFQAGDSSALASALRDVWNDPALAGKLRARGFARVAQMTWRSTAEKTLEVFEAMVNA